MVEGATVKKFLDAIEEMRTIYPFEDDKARLATMDMKSLSPRCLTIVTTDEKTGVYISMSKEFDMEW